MRGVSNKHCLLTFFISPVCSGTNGKNGSFSSGLEKDGSSWKVHLESASGTVVPQPLSNDPRFNQCIFSYSRASKRFVEVYNHILTFLIFDFKIKLL